MMMTHIVVVANLFLVCSSLNTFLDCFALFIFDFSWLTVIHEYPQPWYCSTIVFLKLLLLPFFFLLNVFVPISFDCLIHNQSWLFLAFFILGKLGPWCCPTLPRHIGSLETRQRFDTMFWVLTIVVAILIIMYLFIINRIILYFASM